MSGSAAAEKEKLHNTVDEIGCETVAVANGRTEQTVGNTTADGQRSDVFGDDEDCVCPVT